MVSIAAMRARFMSPLVTQRKIGARRAAIRVNRMSDGLGGILGAGGASWGGSVVVMVADMAGALGIRSLYGLSW
jgi:predicted alpha/beta-hydrolase family hydrolase